MLLRKKRKKKKTVLILKTNKKRFQISCSNCTLHWKTNFLWYKNLLQHSCALFDAMIAKLSPQIPPFNFLFMFFSVHFFLPLDKSTVQSKDSYRNKTPSPRKKKLRLCSLQVINTSSHILCLFVMVNKKKKSKQKQQQNQ